MKPLSQLRLDENRYATLPDHFFSRVKPAPLENPFLVDLNELLAHEMGITVEESEKLLWTELCAGQRLPPDSEPIATVYCGHQFGHLVPQLGDGRAILLGGFAADDGQYWELQLKGAGQTAYSRMGDGCAVLRSTIREYLCSEAMHGLGIPTTRALAIVGSEEPVARERLETAASLVRVAPSHLRFGTFEYFYYQNDVSALQALVDFAIQHYFPEFLEYSELPEAENRALALLEEVSKRTAHLIAMWQAVGFEHGVMNSDNMSLLGLTIDYGPFGFMERYQPNWICNHSDEFGRYAFDQQPKIGQWNVSCLAQAMLPLLDENPQAAVEKAKAVIADFPQQFQQAHQQKLREKFGLLESHETDQQLFDEWFALMEVNGSDWTRSFRALGKISAELEEQAEIATVPESLKREFQDQRRLQVWVEKYHQRLRQENAVDATRKARMDQTNPKYVLRTWLAQRAIEQAEKGDFSEVTRLRKLLHDPFSEQPEFEEYTNSPPEGMAGIALSCSS